MKVEYTVKDDEKKLILTTGEEDGWDLVIETKGDFRPMYDNVIIDKDEIAETTSGGIYLTDETRDKTSTATVLAVGNGRLNELTGELSPLTVQVGDRILFAGHNVQEFEYGDKKISIIKEQDILTIIR